MNDAKLQFEDEKTKPVKIKRSLPNSAATYIKQLLADGFRGNKFYYRDNDRRLILKVWEKEGLWLTPDQKRRFMQDVTFPDTITRHRRELRSKYPDSQKVQDKRFKRFVEERDKRSKSTWFGNRFKRANG